LGIDAQVKRIGVLLKAKRIALRKVMANKTDIEITNPVCVAVFLNLPSSGNIVMALNWITRN
jgi:hypothetical protein